MGFLEEQAEDGLYSGEEERGKEGGSGGHQAHSQWLRRWKGSGGWVRVTEGLSAQEGGLSSLGPLEGPADLTSPNAMWILD